MCSVILFFGVEVEESELNLDTLSWKLKLDGPDVVNLDGELITLAECSLDQKIWSRMEDRRQEEEEEEENGINESTIPVEWVDEDEWAAIEQVFASACSDIHLISSTSPSSTTSQLPGISDIEKNELQLASKGISHGPPLWLRSLNGSSRLGDHYLSSFVCRKPFQISWGNPRRLLESSLQALRDCCFWRTTTSNRVKSLQLNGIFCPELVLLEFPLAVFAYNIYNFFPLVYGTCSEVVLWIWIKSNIFLEVHTGPNSLSTSWACQYGFDSQWTAIEFSAFTGHTYRTWKVFHTKQPNFQQKVISRVRGYIIISS